MSKKYTEEFKQSMVKRMLSPVSTPIAELSKETGVSRSALRSWLNNAKGVSTSKSKFHIVVETYSMNEYELSSYCRRNGLFTEDIKQWRAMFEQAELPITPTSDSTSKKDRDRIKKLEIELRRKDKALAETAALLVFTKKLEAVFGNHEDEVL